jgi:protein arginine N-methyltransferase 1
MRLPDTDTRLTLADDLLLRIDGDCVELTLGGHSCRLPLDVLALLAAARDRSTLRTLLERAGKDAVGTLDWIEAGSRVVGLLEFGALRAFDRAADGAPSDALRDRDVAMHIELLDDRERTSAFVQAIERSVRPGDVVVDLGTGTGVLALAAARAGARKVYAIEASGFAAVAEHAARRNGHADRIEVLRGWSHRVELPERADVLVAEIIGNDPLGEGVLRFMPDAVARFLKSGGRVLPGRLRVLATLAAMPAAIAAEHCVGTARLERWRDWYGFDFGDFDRRCAGRQRRGYRRDHELRDWQILSETVELFHVDIGAELPAEASAQRELVQQAPADHPALVLHVEVEFPDGVRLDTCPWRSSNGSWRSPVIGLRRPDVPDGASYAQRRDATAGVGPLTGTGTRWTVRSTWGALHSTVGIDVLRLDVPV